MMNGSSAQEMLLPLISYCTNIFIDPSFESDHQFQQEKRTKLTHLLSIIKHNDSNSPFHNSNINNQLLFLKPLFCMLSSNLFRPLPPPPPPPNSYAALCSFPGDEDFAAAAPVPAWPHLHIVYDILLRLIITADAEALRPHIDRPFLNNLLCLFHSEDPRERERLKNVYHLIYSKFPCHRASMRKAMNDMLLRFTFEADLRHCGIGEVVEIWGSIINGFSVPLKEENKELLRRVIVPLHKAKGMQAYHTQLAYCVSQFVVKEPALCGVVFRGILRYWPLTNCHKEILLLQELEEILDSVDLEHYKHMALPLCTQIIKCVNSCNSQVAERALYMWNNEQFVKLSTQAMELVFPVIVQGIENNLRWHWSKSVKQLTQNVKAMVQKMEPNLYSKCRLQLQFQESIAQQQEINRIQKWKAIEMAAAAASATMNHFLQQPPYCIPIPLESQL